MRIKKSFPIEVGDCFFNESEQYVYLITNVSFDEIHYVLARVHKHSIISDYKSFIERDNHCFDEMIRIDKKTFDEIQNIAKNYENKSNELRLSTIKHANNIMVSIKK